MLVSGLRDESLANLVSGSDVKFADVHKSLRECAQAIRDRYQQKQAKNTVKRRIKTDAIKVLLEELCNVPEDSAAIRETISSALERHVEALRNHEHLLSKKGNTYALLQQTRGLRMGHGDAPAELAPLLKYHDLKDKLLASDSPLSAEKKEVVTMLDTKKGLTLTVLESMDELSRDEATGRLSYIYNGRNFPLQGSSSRGLPENFICCICRNIINQPREVCSESHITCLECAINLKERENAVCPQCRKSPLAKLKESTAIERSIGNLQVHCCNDGCRSVMPISEIKSHLGLCDEEEIECPGKCTDESTNEVLRIPRKRVADHSKECPKHFRCDNCAERFPYNTETKYLKQYQEHMTEKHTTSESTSAGYHVSLIDKLLSLQEQLQEHAQKETVLQAGHTGFQIPFIRGPFTGCDRYGTCRFAGTDCVRTPNDVVYQSKANPRHFFVTLEASLTQMVVHTVTFPFQQGSEGSRENRTLSLTVCFTATGEVIHPDYKQWGVIVPPETNREYKGDACVTFYDENQQAIYAQSIMPSKRVIRHICPYESNRYLFKIAI